MIERWRSLFLIRLITSVPSWCFGFFSTCQITSSLAGVLSQLLFASSAWKIFGKIWNTRKFHFKKYPNNNNTMKQMKILIIFWTGYFSNEMNKSITSESFIQFKLQERGKTIPQYVLTTCKQIVYIFLFLQIKFS